MHSCDVCMCDVRCVYIAYLLSTDLAKVELVTGSMQLSFKVFTVPLLGGRNLIQNGVREQDVCRLLMCT